DFIAGFPTETDEMFENTLNLIDEAGLTWLHVFPYSPRPDTPAARMPQVDARLRHSRAGRLRRKGLERVNLLLQSMVGRMEEALVEKNDGGMALGRTGNYAEVGFESHLPAGNLANLRIESSFGLRLLGSEEVPHRSAA